MGWNYDDYYRHLKLNWPITDRGDWQHGETEVSPAYSWKNAYTVSLHTVNATITGSENATFAGERLCTLQNTHIDNPRHIVVNEDTYLYIDIYGNVFYYGSGVTTETETTITIPEVTFTMSEPAIIDLDNYQELLETYVPG